MTAIGVLHRPAKRVRWRAAPAALPPVLLAGLLSGCVSTVTPPPAPRDPVAVFLLWEARHRALAIASHEGDLAVWSYGDWDWYALGHDAWYHVFDTVLWPTQGTLAQRIVPGRDEAALRTAFPGALAASIVVSGARADALHARLEAAFSGAGSPHWNPRYRTEFVRDPAGFWFLHNCNDAVAAWLEELGCEVSWVPVRLDLSVAPEPR